MYETGRFGVPNGKPSLPGSIFMGPADAPLENSGGGMWGVVDGRVRKLG